MNFSYVSHVLIVSHSLSIRVCLFASSSPFFSPQLDPTTQKHNRRYANNKNPTRSHQNKTKKKKSNVIKHC